MGGSGRWLWELYRRLCGFDVQIAAGAAPGDAEFDRTAEIDIVRVPLSFRSWGVRHPSSTLAYLRTTIAIRRICRRFRPDVIHCGKCLPEGLIGAAIQRWIHIPYVTFVHGEELTLAHGSRELA